MAGGHDPGSAGEGGISVERLTVAVPDGDIGVHRIATFVHILKRLVAPQRRTLVDLGAGHCKFSVWATRLGFEVTAVDGRTVRLPEDLGSIRFVESDVRTYDPSGHGVVAILGLLYHLELGDQESLLRRCRYGAPVIVETQVHVPEMVAHDPKDWHVPVERDGYCGVDFPEGNNPMASIGNKTSFWHTEASMERLFERAGYSRVIVIDPIFMSSYGARRFYVLHA
ncbi:class I SAM-dependent methyltransferase [Roseomonas terrae]|uniref:Class I SAM-dependent methyltransferase n=1 Tax=Neoroseomonas terrae TaxID=424799 RepID=A0ABS5EG62_9PROT|nr:class I SAM-dependent methyltransferase [Neoroseomonas terrae]MBR0650019.1 class I SAM-dependent methyltransferase [Neoroseomonas terrae]